jgi:hypothetical protein
MNATSSSTTTTNTNTTATTGTTTTFHTSASGTISTCGITDLQTLQRNAIIQMLQSSNVPDMMDASASSYRSNVQRKSKIRDPNDLGKSLTNLKISKWRVLVLDQVCRDILTPLLKVGDLRALGITLLLDIKDENRQQIPDAPAVYFVLPTEENIQLIVKDCENDLYESIHVNFATSGTPRSLLEKLATELVHRDCTHKVSKVYDQFLNYRCIEQNFFSLDMSQTLSSLLDPTIKNESDIMQLIESISSGIVSACMTLTGTVGSSNMVVPLIVYPNGRGTPAELVGQTVEKKLRNTMMNQMLLDGSLSTSAANSSTVISASTNNRNKRPLLIIVDRSIDYTVCLQHQWMYRPIIHDLFSIHLNRINMKPDAESNNRKKVYEIEPDDEFWNNNKDLSFPEVAENVGDALDKHKKQLIEFNNKTGLKIDEKELLNTDTSNTEQNNSNKIMSMNKQIIDQVFQLATHRKRVEMHTNIAHAILQQIDQRQLDKFVNIEESLIKNEPLDKKVLLELLNSGGTINDRIRLLCICYLNYINYHASNEEEAPDTKDRLDKDDEQRVPHGLSKYEIDKWEHILCKQRLQEELNNNNNNKSTSRTFDNQTQLSLKHLPELKFLKSRSVSLQGHLVASKHHLSRTANKSSFTNIADSMRKSISIFGESVRNFATIGFGSAFGDKQFNLPLSRVVNALVQNKPSKLTAGESYVFVDPKLPQNNSRVRVMNNQSDPSDGHHHHHSNKQHVRGSSFDQSIVNNNGRIGHGSTRNSGSSNDDSIIGSRMGASGANNADGSMVPYTSEVIVFVVGGGSYMEYHNLSEMFRKHINPTRGIDTLIPSVGGLPMGTIQLDSTKQNPIQFTYGCSDVLNGEGFLKQLRAIGSKLQ